MYEAPLVLGFASGNVAGPRASKEPGIASFVILTLDAVFGFSPYPRNDLGAGATTTAKTGLGLTWSRRSSKNPRAIASPDVRLPDQTLWRSHRAGPELGTGGHLSDLPSDPQRLRLSRRNW